MYCTVFLISLSCYCSQKAEVREATHLRPVCAIWQELRDGEGRRERGGWREGWSKKLAVNLEEQKQQDRRGQRPKKDNTKNTGLITELISIQAGILGYP